MNETIYKEEVDELKDDPRLIRMSSFPQHGSCDTYQHSLNVARASMSIAKTLHIKVKEREMARGAMLHDFYLYNIQESGLSAWRHGTGHPEVALKNAESEFELTPREKNIIYSHMWPLTLTHIPRCRESFIVSLADKYAASKERLIQVYCFAGYLKRLIFGIA